MTKFVHDVADMEVRAFTLREAAKKCREDAHTEQNNLEFLEHRANARLSQSVQILEKCRNDEQKDNHFLKYLFGKHAISFFVGFPILGSIPAIVITVVLFSVGLSQLVASIIGFAVFFAVYGVCAAIMCLASVGGHAKMMEDKKQAVVNAEAEHDSAKKDLKKAQENLKQFQDNNAKIKSIADEFDAQADIVEQRITECYSLNVIKPSYRNLVSVVILDEIFQNDKADTMREANLLCDTEIRHAELVGKLDQVLDALEALALSLQHISRVMNSINENVSMISQDVYRIADGQERIAYATESLQKSADNVDFYVTQKRAGSL